MSHSKINTDQYLDIDGHNMELVNSFVYLGSCCMDGNNELPEIQRRLILANNAYCSHITLMKSSLK
jgi:hypothetical protein